MQVNDEEHSLVAVVKVDLYSVKYSDVPTYCSQPSISSCDSIRAAGRVVA